MSLRVHVTALGTGTDRGDNRRVVATAVRRAVDTGAGVVVLPEYAQAFHPRGLPTELAEPLDGPFVQGLQELTAGREVTVVAGTAVPTPPGADGGARAANVVVVVRGGELVGAYRKVHLYDAFGQRESDRLDAGAADAPAVVVPVGGLRLGVLTCYDLRFPESARRLVDAGADVLVVPAAWADGPRKADHWDTLLRARAIESTAYVVGCAQQGRGVTGASTVVDPEGVVLARAEGPDGAAVADLDAAVVAGVRERNPSLRNRRYRVVPADQPLGGR